MQLTFSEKEPPQQSHQLSEQDVPRPIKCIKHSVCFWVCEEDKGPASGSSHSSGKEEIAIQKTILKVKRNKCHKEKG